MGMIVASVVPFPSRSLSGVTSARLTSKMTADTHCSLAAPSARPDRLPWTILAKIFRDTALLRSMHFEQAYYRISAAVKLSLVCKHWRMVAVGTPVLWGYLDIPPSAAYRMLNNAKRQAALDALISILIRTDFLTLRIRVFRVPRLEDTSLTESQRLHRRSLGMWFFFKVLLERVRLWFKITVQVDHQLLVSRLLVEFGKHEHSAALLGVFSLELVADDDTLLLGPALNERREAPRLRLPGHKYIRFMSLKNLLIDWDASFFGVDDAEAPFRGLYNLSITYPLTELDPHRLWKVPSFDIFTSMLLSLPALCSLDLCVFGPNEHTFPRLTQHSYLWLDELHSLSLSGMRPAYMARLLQYFNLSRLTELVLYMGPTAAGAPLGLAETDYEWAPVLAVLRGDMHAKFAWLSLASLTTLKLYHIDAPWADLAAVFLNAPAVTSLLIPATEAPALLVFGDAERRTCVLPALKKLNLEGPEASYQVAQMVRKTLVQRARRMPKLEVLEAPDWLCDCLCDFGAPELYVDLLFAWPV